MTARSDIHGIVSVTTESNEAEVEAVEDTYGNHHPDFQKKAAEV